MSRLLIEFAVFLALLAAALAAAGRSDTPATAEQQLPVCQTPQCLALSALITSNMDPTADPCEDFNAYACGNYALNNLYDPASLTWSVRDEPLLMQNGLSTIRNQLGRRIFELLLFQRPVVGEDPEINTMNRLAGSLFRSCSGWLRKRDQRRSPNGNLEASSVFFNGVLSHLLESIGTKTSQAGWFERALAKMVRFGAWPMFGVGSTYSALMGSAGKDQATRVSLSHSVWDLTNMNISTYTKFFKTLSTAGTVNFDSPDEFEKLSRELKRNVSGSYDYVPVEKKLKRWGNCTAGENFLKQETKTDFTIRELDALSKCADPQNPFSWAVLFDGVLDGSVDQDTPINVRNLNTALDLVNLVTFLKRRSLPTSRDGKMSLHFSYLVFDLLLSFASYFPEDVARQWEKNPIRRNRIPALEGEDPINDCMMLTKGLLSPVVERMFQKSHHEDTFDRVRTLVDLIQNASIDSVRKEKWITPSAKEAIIDKIVSLKKEIGFEVVSVDKMKKFYASVIRSFKQGNYSMSYRNFGTLVAYALCAYAGKQNNLLSTDAPASVLGSSDALVVNAFSYNRKNRIVFPMGILSPFLYHKSYPDYINLGGLGVVIGHEVGHGFDDMGHELNKLGIGGHFWDNQTEAGYLRRMDCVKSRFAGYELVPGRWHDSNLTVGNDIADLMGIRSAYGALQLLGQRGKLQRLPHLPESLTPERLFFVQAAQAWCSKSEPGALVEAFKYSRHSPPHVRIRGMMENSRDFAAVFQCRRGQAMNPSDKCEFW